MFASIFYVIAVLIKPQALIFGPIGLIVLIESRDWRTILTSLLAMMGTFIILILPFSLKQTNPFWIINVYQRALGTYDLATLNAFNLYALFGANMAELTQKLLFIPISVWGYIFITLILGFCTLIYVRNFQKLKNQAWPFSIALFLITAFFMLVFNMHERYLYPALILCLLCYVTMNDKRFLFVFLGFSITILFNQELVLYLAYNYDITQIVADHPVEYNLMRIVSAINLGLFIYLIKIGCDIYLRGKSLPVGGRTNSASLPADQEKNTAQAS